MDDVIECIVELLMDGIIEIVQEPRIPKWIRGSVLILVTVFYLALFQLILVTVFYLALFLLFLWLAVQVPQVWVKCLLIAVSLLILGLLGRMWYKLMKE